jgi:hypothetical protein
MPSFSVKGALVSLDGDAVTRGRSQAACCPEAVGAVRAMVVSRLAGTVDLVASHAGFLRRQWDETARLDPAGLAEMRGVAEGFAIPERVLLAFLFAGQLAGAGGDECSAWAFGSLVGKNRDLRAPVLAVQRVFLHCDPAWHGRRVLCVGSLGAPGAYSSGMNSDGLALADTQVVTRDQGPGLLRYFLMGKLLAECGDVGEALELSRRIPHAGGGNLILADAGGAMASVEIGHRALAIKRSTAGWVARTNHFLAPALRNTLVAPGGDSSAGRLATLTGWLAGLDGPPDEATAASIMSSHDTPDGTGLCRHGEAGGSATVSCHLYDCAARTLTFAYGNPCAGNWFRTALSV